MRGLHTQALSVLGIAGGSAHAAQRQTFARVCVDLGLGEVLRDGSAGEVSAQAVHCYKAVDQLLLDIEKNEGGQDPAQHAVTLGRLTNLLWTAIDLSLSLPTRDAALSEKFVGLVPKFSRVVGLVEKFVANHPLNPDVLDKLAVLHHSVFGAQRYQGTVLAGRKTALDAGLAGTTMQAILRDATPLPNVVGGIVAEYADLRALPLALALLRASTRQ